VPGPFEWSRRSRTGEGESLPATERLGDLEYSATDYFGNEGGDSAFYVSAALLIEVPPADERVGRSRLVEMSGGDEAKARWSRRKVATRAELLAAGLASSTVQTWLRQGHLEPTEQRGRYRLTSEARRRLAERAG